MMQSTDQINFNSVALVILGVALTAFIGWWARSSTARKSRLKDLEAEVAKLKLDAAVNETKITPLWAKVQKQLSEDLHHPHAKDKEVDLLLEKLETAPPTISIEETSRLKELLEHRATDMSSEITESERASARIMAVVMDKVLEETADTSETQIEMVSVPKDDED